MKAKLRRALRGLLERYVEVEIIGQEACPLMMRWEFLDVGFLKAMIHYFPAEVSDRDPYDHPRPFVTLVLRGNYRDESWERIAGGYDAYTTQIGRVVKERLHAGSFRYRPAEHLHIVETDAVGCWTLVVMGPIVREWGFVRLASGSWWPWGKYVQKFGGVIRCDAPADTMNMVVDEVDISDQVFMLQSPDPIPLDPEHVVPKAGYFVRVVDPSDPRLEWEGKVESVSNGTAWIRNARTFEVEAVKVWKLRRPVDPEDLFRRYYRRGGA